MEHRFNFIFCHAWGGSWQLRYEKGRELDRTLPEAPRSAYPENAPSHAQAGVPLVGLWVENSRFTGETVAKSYAIKFLDCEFFTYSFHIYRSGQVRQIEVQATTNSNGVNERV